MTATRIPKWLQRPDVLSYVIDSYTGVEPARSGGASRRVFLWEDDDVVKMGNTEAFAEHLVCRYELLSDMRLVTIGVHALLRALGERIVPAAQRMRRVTPKEQHLPEPDYWVVRRKPRAQEVDALEDADLTHLLGQADEKREEDKR